MRNIIAELDKIAKYIEDFEEPWTYTIVWRLDKISQQLSDLDSSKNEKMSKISKNILEQYMDNMTFLTKHEKKLTNLIKNHEEKNADAVYRSIKAHFGKLDKKESIEFIKNVLKKLK